MVQAVSDMGCANHHAAPIPRSGRDPYLYTVGLTVAGLPELLLLRLTDRNTQEWLRAAGRLLDTAAAHTMHAELKVGQRLPYRGGVTITVAEPPTFSIDDGGFWPGMAYALYGRDRVQVLELMASW